MDNDNVPTINFDNTKSAPSTNPKQVPRKRQIFAWLKYRHSQLNKKQKWMVGGALAGLIICGFVGGFFLYKHFHKPTPSSYSSPAPPKTTEPSRLTGVEVSKELNNRPVTGVMIENSVAARPQSGLLNAGVVFEAVAEGGITRFLVLYQDAQPKYIGPVRSVRPYYLDWLMPFNASIAHIGGAPQAIKDIKSFHVRDLDQFYNSAYYQRISSRPSPHNVYTSMAMLDKLNQSKGYKSSDFTGFPRKKEAPTAKPTARLIDFAISSYNFNVHYDYDAATNNYLRSVGGSKHLDEKSKKRLAPKVVIALVMSRGIASDGQHTKYGTTGSGRAYIFQDGKVVVGIWKKSKRETQLQFLNSDGTVIRLNPGQTWITLVDGTGAVKYKP